MVHPLPDRLVVVGWRSRKAGLVEVSGSVSDRHDVCGDGFDWSVDHGSTTLVSGFVPNGGSMTFADAAGSENLVVEVAKGDFLYFVVGPGPSGEHRCDSTALDVTVRATPRHRG